METETVSPPENRIATQAKRCAELKAARDIAKAAASLAEANYKAAASKMIQLMEEQELKSVVAAGFTFFPVNKETVSMPEDLGKKKEFFAFLEEKGVFLETVTVHSQRLQSFYKTLADEALQNEILDFRIPGLAEPKSYTSLGMRKKTDKKSNVKEETIDDNEHEQE